MPQGLLGGVSFGGVQDQQTLLERPQGHGASGTTWGPPERTAFLEMAIDGECN